MHASTGIRTAAWVLTVHTTASIISRAVARSLWNAEGNLSGQQQIFVGKIHGWKDASLQLQMSAEKLSFQRSV